MQSNSSGFRALVYVAVATAASAATYTAAAQQKQEEITVEATRPRRADNGAPIRDVSTQRVVSYGDISLTTPSGISVLETRIRDAARTACAELEQKYPVAAEGDSTEKCFNNAVEDSMADARKAIEAAKQKAPGSYAAAVPAIQAREEITVEAATGAARSTTGAPIQNVTAKRMVSYADISLTTQSGVTVLESRIREAASSACTELVQKYPVAAEGDTTKKCFDDAVEGAMADVRKAIDSAKLASDSD